MKSLYNQLFEIEKNVKNEISLVNLKKEGLKPRHLILEDIKKDTIIFHTETLFSNSELNYTKGKILLNNIEKFIDRFLESDKLKILNYKYRYNKLIKI